MKLTIYSLLAAGLLLSLSTAHATSIGINFTDSQDTLFGSGVSAGAPGYAQANWNHVTTDWSGSPGNDALFTAGMLDDSGAVVSGTLLQNIAYVTGHNDPAHFDAANTWRSGAGNTTADHTLLNGYLDDGGNDQPYLNLRLGVSVTSYDVVIYLNGDNGGSSHGRYWLEEWTDPVTAGTPVSDFIGVAANGGFSGTYAQAGGGNFTSSGAPVNQDVSGGHYLVFEDITISNLRIRSAGNGDPEDFGRGPLNAVQIVNIIPEPGSLGLFSLGLLVLALRRRR